MSEFNFDLFTKPDQYEETLLHDRKACVKYWRDSERAEFVRDVIALANTARMLGKPAYLILGVRNAAYGTSNDICGIGEMFDRLIDNGNTEIQAFENMRHEMSAIIKRYVLPSLIPEIEFNKIDGKIVGYVLIPPLTGEPFYVNREFRSGNQTYLRPGQCWLRIGESKHEIEPKELAPDDDKLRNCYAEVPYVLPSIWQRYFDQIQREMQNLWQRFSPPEESAYQKLHDRKGIPIQKIVDDFLAQNDERLLILQGAAGCGKSLFVQRLVNILAQQGAKNMKDALRLEQFTPPDGFIPIHCRLRYLTPKARTESAQFTKTLCNLLAVLWEDQGRRPRYPEKLLENPKLNWLIVLDGLDEIGAYARRRKFLNMLTEFMYTYPRLLVILTTRLSPGVSLEGMENAKLVEIAPLDEEQITDFLGAYRTDRNEEEIYAFIQECKRWEDAWKLLSVPAYLNAAMLSVGIPRTITDVQEQPVEPLIETPLIVVSEAAQDLNSSKEIFSETPSDESLEVDQPVTSEPAKRDDDKRDDEREEEFIITLPRLLDQVYEAFWEREEKRRLENVNHFRCGTHKLAAKSMSICPAFVQRDQAKRVLQEKGLRCVLEMGVLSENKHENIFFTIPSTQVYSAAKQLQGDIESGFRDCISRYVRRWQEAYRAEIENFYEDLTGKSLSTLL